MRAVVIGYGSIGKRHIEILNRIGCNVSAISNRQIDYTKAYHDLRECINIENPQYVVVANKTSNHYETLKVLQENKYKGIVLIEKPIFEKVYTFSKDDCLNNVFVGYNLRFHPLILELQEILKNEKVISANIYVGQYLPLWRPTDDYRKSYSAKEAEGGGVLGDLSHELDYMQWLLGNWRRLSAIGGHFSDLEIDSEDTISVLLETERCPNVCIHMNYLDRCPNRKIIINTLGKTIIVDLINNYIQVNEQIKKINIERNDTYTAQHEAVLAKKFQCLCTLDEGLKTVKLIETIKTAIQTKGWVVND